MTQSIIIQVGQCGNQIGYKFWDEALKEHASVNSKGLWEESISSFFENVDSKTGKKIPVKNGTSKIKQLKARAVLIDMEEGVINEIRKSPLSQLFDNQQLITDVSGAGNNWAVGHFEYGSMYHDKISDVIRRTVEPCDCLQCFFCIHSMGGGTGSGVGTCVLRILEDEYKDVCRFVKAIYPSIDDDVITSPYNSLLAMHQLSQAADCVVPIENQSLMNMISKFGLSTEKNKREKISTRNLLSANHSDSSKIKNSDKPFDEMNNLVAKLILNLTSSSRFEGSLNVDLNEISMNLVPFPNLHYLVAGMSPIAQSNMHLRRLNQMFSDVFSKDHQLLNVDPKHSLYLACGLMLRGNVEISYIRSNIDRLKTRLQFVHWNQEGWKTGLCSVPPINQKSSLLALSNNTCFKNTCLDVRNRFVKIYKRKAHVHHYTKVQGFEEALFTESLNSIDWLIDEYEKLENSVLSPAIGIERLKIA